MSILWNICWNEKANILDITVSSSKYKHSFTINIFFKKSASNNSFPQPCSLDDKSQVMVWLIHLYSLLVVKVLPRDCDLARGSCRPSSEPLRWWRLWPEDVADRPFNLGQRNTRGDWWFGWSVGWSSTWDGSVTPGTGLNPFPSPHRRHSYCQSLNQVRIMRLSRWSHGGW